MRRVTVLIILLIVVVGGCTGTDEVRPPDGARTYFEALDLSTPTAAAETFLDAFARDDFQTVWLTLYPTTQDTIDQALDHLQFQLLVDHELIPRDEFAEVHELFPLLTDTWHRFDALMLRAAEYDAFIVDLGEPATFSDDFLYGAGAVVPLKVELEGIDNVVSMQMTRAPDGTWRVAEVTMGDPVLRQWPAFDRWYPGDR